MVTVFLKNNKSIDIPHGDKWKHFNGRLVVFNEEGSIVGDVNLLEWMAVRWSPDEVNSKQIVAELEQVKEGLE